MLMTMRNNSSSNSARAPCLIEMLDRIPILSNEGQERNPTDLNIFRRPAEQERPEADCHIAKTQTHWQSGCQSLSPFPYFLYSRPVSLDCHIARPHANP